MSFAVANNEEVEATKSLESAQSSELKQLPKQARRKLPTISADFFMEHCLQNEEFFETGDHSLQLSDIDGGVTKKTDDDVVENSSYDNNYDTARNETASSPCYEAINLETIDKKVVVSKRSKTCEFPDCQEAAIFVCSASFYKSDIGCGRSICDDHRSKKSCMQFTNWASYTQQELPSAPCIKHGQKIQRRSRLIGLVLSLIASVPIIFMVILLATEENDIAQAEAKFSQEWNEYWGQNSLTTDDNDSKFLGQESARTEEISGAGY